jgi:pyridoxine 4-dehydrogenase
MCDFPPSPHGIRGGASGTPPSTRPLPRGSRRLRSHAADRTPEQCTRRGIAFVPFSPLGSGSRGVGSALGAGGVLRVAACLDCSPAQVVLAWALRAAPNILLIPGTASRAHLRENLDAAKVTLDADAVRELSRL